jgi:carboxyl-terminal processing protease
VEIFMNKRSLMIFGVLAAVVFIAGTFAAGVIVGNAFLPQTTLSGLPVDPMKTPGEELPGQPNSSSMEELFQPFWEAWAIVQEQYVDQPVDNVALMRGAISGMLEALGDQHTSYMDPDEFYQANIPMDGEYEGIGAWVDTDSEYLTIISPMPDSPAEKAGLQPGDEVIAINGEDMTGIDGNVAIKKVLGPAGSEVVLTIRREGRPDPFDVSIIREKISLPSVEVEFFDEENIGYVQIYTFGSDTRGELRDGLQELLDKNPDGLVVDLRNNGGGYLQTAVHVASEFISEEVILYEDYGPDQELKTFEAKRGGLATDIPLVLLVNEGSASASEIVAGAFQDYQRAPLVGKTTFGKGSVQNWIELSDDQGAVRVTIARWLTPDMRQIHEEGLTPEYEVEYTEEDFQNEQDPQLEKAVEVLLDLIEERS